MEKIKEFFRIIARFVVRGAIYLFFKIVYRAKIEGVKNIPKNEALIFCGNHRNYVDPPLIVSTARRNVRFISKEELKKNPLFWFLGIIFKGIYVKRDAKDISALKEALKGLKNGECIGIFPEGTRNASEKGEKSKGGAAFFTVKSGAKVVPVGITGGMKPWQKVTIKYGEPLDFSNYTDTKNKEELEQVTNTIMEKVFELVDTDKE